MAATQLLSSRRGFLLSAMSKPLSLAEIQFDTVRRGRSKRRYLHIHGDEATARDVLREHSKSHPGRYFFIAGQKRTVPVGELVIDPNRMFTLDGARKSLISNNRDATPAQIEASMAVLNRDRPAFLKAVLPPKGGLMVAMHNNSNGYSVENEIPISNKVSFVDKEHPHEFILATNEGDFAHLARGKWNVVLQETVPQDDGSFSVLSARLGLRYCNIEAGAANFNKQRDMLLFLEEILP